MNSLNQVLTRCLETLPSCRITCCDKGVEIVVNGESMVLDRRAISDYFDENTCVTTRVVNLFKPIVGKEIAFLALLACVTSCFWNTKVFVLIDDSMSETMELAGLINNLIRVYGARIDDLVDIDLEFTYNRVKELEKNLERYRSLARYPSRSDEAVIALQEIDRVLMDVVARLRNKTYILEAMLELIKTKNSGESHGILNDIIESFYTTRIREFREAWRVSSVEPRFVNLSLLTSGRLVAFKEAFNLFDSYMRREGCVSILVVDGEEYEAIVKLLKLNWKVISPPL